tara:strand:- start:14798 stop:15544 length:747 start_codon:yes stop_codon:yes gene_type:complete
MLKQALKNKQSLLGTFIKTPHYNVVEVLAHASMDVLCLDAEHAPFSRQDLDTCILAARAGNMPVLVRTPNDAPETLLNVLDMGADGVVVPHVKTAEQLSAIVRHCHYGAGGRGYAGSSRFAGYTTKPLSENLEAGKNVSIVAQLEDLDAIDNIEAIAHVDGVDCLFIGRMDLTVALGETSADTPKVKQAVEHLVEVSHRAGKATGMFVGNLEELAYWKEKGVSLFLLGSDHGFMLSGAKALRETFDKA